MGNSNSASSHRKQSRDAITQRFDDMHPNYQNSYRLLSDLVGDKNKRRVLARLKGEEAQGMVDFLNRVLERKDFEGRAARKDVLHTLASLSRLAQVFPECLKLTGVHCEFNPLLHHGAAGDIYKGTYGGQVVCVKSIRMGPTGYTHEQLIKIHAKEAIISAHMLHQNILPFHGVYITNEELSKVCIISPWMENGDLSKYLKDYPDIPRVPLMSDVISGLKYMHELDIIHSDLKAKNVLVSDEGRAILADFGASRVSAATRTDTSVGESNWTAPELLLGSQSTANKQSDIWSYACTCYEIMTGTTPFHQFSGFMALTGAFQQGITRPTRPAAAFKVDNGVWKKMESCWDLQPNNRPTAAGLCTFFAGLGFRDDRPQGGACKSRIRSDSTAIDEDLVYQTLQHVQQTANPSTTNRRTTV